MIQGVFPFSITVGGGDTVQIWGSFLCNGNDITAVTLAGVPATILTQNATAVTVKAGAASAPVDGDVAVVSASRGTTLAVGRFSYTARTLPRFVVVVSAVVFLF